MGTTYSKSGVWYWTPSIYTGTTGGNEDYSVPHIKESELTPERKMMIEAFYNQKLEIDLVTKDMRNQRNKRWAFR